MIANRYYESDDLLVIVGSGRVSGDEMERFVVEQLAADPSWPQGKRRLSDITTLDPSLLTLADVVTVTALFRERLQNLAGARQAIVASQGWELAREFERYIDRLGATTVVFNRVKDACVWLGIDPVLARQRIAALRAGLRHD